MVYEFTKPYPEAFNVTLRLDGWWLSFNDFDFSRVSPTAASIRLPSETAVCIGDDSAEAEFYILHGDHRAAFIEILEATPPAEQLDSCMAYYREHYPCP